MMAILEPFQKDATTIRADDLRNLLIVSGTELELRHMLETIDMFDVNWLAGMSVGLFTLQSADVKTVVAELDKAMGPADKSPLAGILRIIPIERMNALLVVTPQPAVPRGSQELDRPAGQGRRRRRRPLLRLSGAEQPRRAHRPAAAAGVHRPHDPADDGRPADAGAGDAGRDHRLAAELSGPAFVGRPDSAAAADDDRPAAGHAADAGGPVAQAVARALANTPVAADGSVGVVRNVQVVADKDNNTILIVATPAEYAVIEAALKKLDVPQRQVLIQLTIAEVTLTDDLTFGIDWLFRGGAPSGRGSGGNFNSTKTPFNPQPTPTSTPRRASRLWCCSRGSTTS